MDINIESNENGVRCDSINVTAVEDRILIANIGKEKKKNVHYTKWRTYCLASKDQNPRESSILCDLQKRRKIQFNSIPSGLLLVFRIC